MPPTLLPDLLRDLPLPWLAALAAVFGLVIGSFVNVVAHRLPLMLERRWAAQDAAAGTAPAPLPPTLPEHQRYNLAWPGSHCPHCKHALAWHHNLPLLSFVALRGRCAHCRASIGLHYPLVELCTALWFAGCVLHWGAGWAALCWAGFGAALIALAVIDWQTTCLPDEITQPLLWSGLMGAALGVSGTTLDDALWGAVAGYLSLWTVCRAFESITGRVGMGEGDFKLLAALGAWAGWQALLPVVLLASIAGVAAGLVMRSRGTLREGGYLPFGPFLAAAGLWVAMDGADPLLHWLGLGMLA